MKQNISKMSFNLQKGFTIVELLVVVVIIAILATINIVAYNGIQTRANNSSALATANTLARKIQAYYSLNGTYPTGSTVALFTGSTNLGKYPESALPTSGINIHTTAVPLSASTGDNTVKVEICTGGVRITPWDYQKSPTPGDSASPISVGSTTAGCTLITA